MATIDLKICMGTMCYVMGGAELRGLVETLPEEIRQHLAVSYSPCLGTCDKAGTPPPFIELDGEPIGGVSKNNLLQILKEALSDVI